MLLKCPACRSKATSAAWESEALGEQFMLLLAEMPTPVSSRLFHYLALFRGTTGRPLIQATALRLAMELRALVNDGTIQWDRKPARPNSVAAWSEAMERVIQNPPRRLPLKSHGYLHAIAYEIADGADRAREIKHNQAERDGSLRREIAKRRDSQPDEPLPPDVLKAIREKNMGSKK